MTLLPEVMSPDGSHCPPQIELSPKNTYVLEPWGCCIEPGANEEVEMVETLSKDTTKETTPGRPRFLKQKFTSLGSLEEFVRKDVEPSFMIRVFSICQLNSWEPLDITEEMLTVLLNHQSVPEEFTEVIRSHVWRQSSTEEAYCGHWFNQILPNAQCVSYTYKYPERRHRTGEPWSIRQTSVYCNFDEKFQRSSWLILHPLYQSKAKIALETALASEIELEKLRRQPLMQHILLLSTYFTMWRDYVAHYEEEFLDINKTMMGATVDNNLPISPETLTRVRFIESRLLPLVPIFSSYDETFNGIMTLNTVFFSRKSVSLESYTQLDTIVHNLVRQNAAYARNTKHVLGKITSIAQLLSDALALKNQHIAQDQNNHLTNLARIAHAQNKSICRMTQLTVQDSAALRVIAIATLAFLPSTFVATLFGTQLFYLTPSHTLAVSREIWLLAAISLPLTVLTMLYWVIHKRKHELRRSRLYQLSAEADEAKGS